MMISTWWSCCQYDKDTKMKANHNFAIGDVLRKIVVASTTKIQKWKQITTNVVIRCIITALLPVRQRYKNESKSQHIVWRNRVAVSCCQYDKDTKMKANHNQQRLHLQIGSVVASTTKIQKWKQITTMKSMQMIQLPLLPVRQRYKNESKSQLSVTPFCSFRCCCQYDKDTKMKANHNPCTRGISKSPVVASTTKIQKWKQITTCSLYCFHSGRLLPVRQRYKNESKSQPQGIEALRLEGCCQYDKDTKMKANHNWSLNHINSW